MAHILIADDDEIIAELASDALIDAGHACGWVCDGTAAWQFLQNRRPDVMLLDQSMPGMSGSTLLRKMRMSPSLYDLPVIMFTVMTGARDEEQAVFAGAQDFVRKPFDRKALVYKVNRLIQLRGDRPRHLDLRTWLQLDHDQAQSHNMATRRAV
ncbi:MAG: response regulator [Pseudomonadota bacterium]